LKCLVDVSPNDIPIYLNASDVILLTSHSEGSPNIVKEAMACNVPVVSTDVGDVRWLLDNVSNSYVAENTPTDIANKLILVLDTNSSSNGRDQLKKLGLESESFALRIQKLYESILC
jgi:glycosyltransferase involved in cell wall biosynthesis